MLLRNRGGCTTNECPSCSVQNSSNDRKTVYDRVNEATNKLTDSPWGRFTNGMMRGLGQGYAGLPGSFEESTDPYFSWGSTLGNMAGQFWGMF